MGRPDASALWLLLLTGTAQAQERLDPQWLIERPAHRALADARAGIEPDPFTTDGGSGGLSAVWSLAAEVAPSFHDAFGGRPPWEACCVDHDRLYHAAGDDAAPAVSYAARLSADVELEACVRAVGRAEAPATAAREGLDEETVVAAYGAVARAMFLAVRFGGAPCSGLPWRWGYGYPHCAVLPGDLASDP